MKNYIVEFIGTMFLVLVIGLSGDPLAIGCTLMAMVFMGGHVSGAHYNPAVSFAVMLRGKLTASDMFRYWIAQLLGALVGGATSYWLKGTETAIAVNENYDVIQALGVEILFTFALASVVLNVATSTATANNSFYGIAIGLTLFAAATAGGGISGGVFNPAVGIGHNVWAQSWGDIWIRFSFFYISKRFRYD